MAVSTKELVWSRLHFLVRVLGLGGALTAVVAVVLKDVKSFAELEAYARSGEAVALYVGAGLVALALLVELVALLGIAAGRRNALGLSAGVQVALAAALLVGVNVFSFLNPVRYDATRGREFTLPDDVREGLARLDPKEQTTVVVYQLHKASAGADKPDLYDAAAERKVTEKVFDLVGLLREVGPKLRVEVLDVQAKGYKERLDRLTDGNAPLREAIEAAQENSLFVAGAGHLQQMTFAEFYRLDRPASQEGRGNLVLLGQGKDGRGIGPFVRRVLNLEQRRPRVGVLVIHELLTTKGSEDSLTLRGARQTLERNGFEVRDVVLKRGWNRRGMPEPAADTFEESELDRVEAELARLERLEKLVKDLAEAIRLIPDAGTAAGADAARPVLVRCGYRPPPGPIPAEDREVVIDQLRDRYEFVKGSWDRDGAKRREALTAQKAAMDLDRIGESRRMTDVKAKLREAVADCDLLILPRMTRRASGGTITPRLHDLTADQVEVLKAFVRDGRPVLACLGPINDEPGPRPAEPAPDDLEKALGQLGFHVGTQTVLFDTDAELFEAIQQDLFRVPEAKAPRIDFRASAGAAVPAAKRSSDEPGALLHGLRVLDRSQDGGLDVRLRFPRPVYHETSGRLTPGSAFLITAGGWADAQPFATDARVPKYEPPVEKDGKKDARVGTFDEPRLGAYAIGSAAEVRVPADWGVGTRLTDRVAVIGHGDVFNGAKLDPARERVLLATVNWLLGREDALPSDESRWSYPRLGLEPGSRDHDRWLWGTRVGLPIVFGFLGAVVLLFRRLR